MTILDHYAAAELLFAAHRVPDRDNAAALIAEQYEAHHRDPSHFADELAAEMGDYPEEAVRRMTLCLRVAPDNVELPDRAEHDALYTGMGDGDADY